ncbi:Zn-dependent hydrolase [uncultured Acetobacteroides sp.]|uniref:dipeptidyl-peptidase 3 family protein n=1 Tax=uncultured Acetobacteroides sp. TaxID=1760811 RepID=UPI0029F5AD99|nr:Zn-dependent hydrolase [uncultured Acetobacteroides sp.]
MKNKFLFGLVAATLLFTACGGGNDNKKTAKVDLKAKEESTLNAKVAEYADFNLTADISNLSDKEKKILIKLFEVSRIMDDIYWLQAFGDKSQVLDTIKGKAAKKYFTINYGPWDRLDGNKSFIRGFEEKPLGANFYPTNMTKSEFEEWDSADKKSQYTIVRRDEAGQLASVPYSVAYSEQIEKAAKLLDQAAKLADNKQLKKYLATRAKSFRTDNYYPSDLVWMDMKNSNIDFVAGPIENYEDELFNYKTAFEAYILLKNHSETKYYNQFIKYLPKLQKALPVQKKYKKEVPAKGSDIGVYSAIYYAGDCNAAGKTIAINLPNDPRVQLKKGSRKLMLKNVMEAKFNLIVKPISEVVIDPSQANLVTFNAFFQNTMFHEVAHGLGIKNTINKKGAVREALKEQYSALEENKADILGLYMIGELVKLKALPKKALMENYVTFTAGIFRSVRFGAASSHGKANMATFNYFVDNGAISRNNKTGYYTINEHAMKQAIKNLSHEILVIQGNGDYEAALKRASEKGTIPATLKKDLKRIDSKHIPRDLNFIQGPNEVGLSKF